MLVTEGSGSGLSLRSDDLNSVGELYSKDDFRQLVIAIETTPAFFGGRSELHRQRGLPSGPGGRPVRIAIALTMN
jgi:hypothetical protein